jgi:hypothetical protein
MRARDGKTEAAAPAMRLDPVPVRGEHLLHLAGVPIRMNGPASDHFPNFPRMTLSGLLGQ